MQLRGFILDVPDYPREGIVFKDITPLLKDRKAFRECIDQLVKTVSGMSFEYVLGVEARGFILGGAVAYRLGKGFIPARKRGKLPRRVLTQEYALEYGAAALDMHADAVEGGGRVLIIDDLLATGGTALAAARLIEGAGGIVAGAAFVIELGSLNGRKKLDSYKVLSLLRY
ncbi:MAG: adenine phosphoribosyltransferase [Candidatus Marsarchaeota archaeon]|nr:adenine phosphoribosyltransferase [Candidatus Marsarchaeota archaeon]